MATDQKIENLLNLALDVTLREREQSLELDIGYDPTDNTWDLIVKYSGDILRLADEEIRIVPLLGGYAVVTAPERRIAYLAAQPEIEYMEKPKRLFFSAAQGRTASCMDVLQQPDIGRADSPVQIPGVTEALLGRGILIAVIDSGVDYAHPDFRNADGSSRIAAIWDQTVPGNPPEGYFLGTEFTRQEIDEALRFGIPLPTRDLSGHGTQVLGIAAGSRGVAPESDLLVVKLGSPRPDTFPRTTELMQAADYVFRKAQEMGMPLALNLSFGNSYGPHDGSGLLERYLSNLADSGRAVIAVGTGNEGSAAGHAAGQLGGGEAAREGNAAVERSAGSAAANQELSVAPSETSLNVQLWKSYADAFDIFLVHPNGQILGPLQENLGAQRFFAGNTEILIYYGEPSPYSEAQEIYFDFLPRGTALYIDSGIWQFRFVLRSIRDGRYDLWLPSASVLNPGTRFYRPAAANTLTIPSTAARVIAVGAYDSRSLTYAPFSGRGDYPFQPGRKPDLAAPGVGIATTAAGGGYTTVTGTSFATPFVTGAAAMLMQWGIVLGNDPYLYGEKVRAYLNRGARRLPGEQEYPNDRVGWGTLCVRDSLPK